MNLEYIKENYIFEKLTEEHNLEDFDCESEDLTDFLKNDALKQQKMHLNFYVDKNKFKYLTKNNDIIRNIETIKQINPERTIPLYIDLKNIKT